MKPLRILVVGAVPPPIGGVTILLEALLRELQWDPTVEVSHVEVPVHVSGRRAKTLAALRVAREVRSAARSADVVTLHLPTMQLHTLAPVLATALRGSGKPLVVRKFGGTDPEGLGRAGWPLARSVLQRADVYLAEALALVRSGRDAGLGQVLWFPNHRAIAPADPAAVPDPLPTRFAFVSQVRRVKGIPELIQAFEEHLPDAGLDIWGPLHDYSAADFEGLARVRYRGVLQPGEVAEHLARYRAILLPTYHPGEGYPGILLEAYATGTPVIVSVWRFLPEIVDESCGILVPPHDVGALAEAVERLRSDDDLYRELRLGAIRRAAAFDATAWARHFARLCHALHRGEPVTGWPEDAAEAAGANP